MKAVWNGAVIAEADASDTIEIEGNSYFPPDSLVDEHFEDSDQTSICPWKGEASYRTVIVDGERNEAAAWHYSEPKSGSVERVGRDFRDYVAFWNGVEVTS